MEKVAILKEFPLFNHLNDKELTSIASVIKEKAYADGELVCQQGEPGGSLYLIKQGTVAITIPLYRYEKKCQVVSSLGEGMFFGELSFFDGKEHSANIHAKGKLKLLELKKTDYENIIADDPETGYNIQNKIILNLISSVRKMNERYSLNVFVR